jgi:hypothetical protein
VYASQQPRAPHKAIRTGGIERDVAEFTGGVPASAHDLSVDDETGAHAVRHGDVNEIGDGRSALAEPHLGERAGDRRVLDEDRQSRCALELSANVDVAPAELRRVDDASGEAIDHAGHDEANALDAIRRMLGVDHARDALHQFGDERVWLEDRLERLHENRIAREIGEHDVRAAEADVDADREAVTRADVELRGFASPIGFADFPFDDRAFREQLLHERRHHSPADRHSSRELGAGDWLVFAHETQRDLPIDVARRRSRSSSEVERIDLTQWGGGGGERRRRGTRVKGHGNSGGADPALAPLASG